MMKKVLLRIFMISLALVFISTAGFAADEVKLININSANKEVLMTLPGISAAYAQRIISGRPYAKKDQLKTKKIIPADVYEKIKDKIVVKQLS
ncbi:MAG: helix-hairpin-helix domain-containing protein [Deltaproteobacteria bacterium]|nr:helix-hairpin-helix domain-containing protein [Deltaproteobacteria bacterium]